MGERKGQNKYYPPDFDYKIHKSLSGYHGEHPLRERAKAPGILIIRFEMPYNIWCDKCNNHIGMGVRYNAEKSKIGNYYTTPIFKFRMKCHLCDNHFEIKTDPANHDYVIISGARRKEQRWDPHENEQIVPEDRDNQKKLVLDSMYKLEHSSNDLDKGKTAAPRLAQIMEIKSSQKDDFSLNQLARKKFRESKQAAKAILVKNEEVKKRLNLSIDLLPESESDVHKAKLLKLSSVKKFQEVFSDRQRNLRDHLLFDEEKSKSTSGLKSMTPKEVSRQTMCNIFSSINKKKRSEAFSIDIKNLNSSKRLKTHTEPSESLADNSKTKSPSLNCATESNGDGLSTLVQNYSESQSSDSD